MYVWASFVGSLYAVCLSSLCIAHEKTCLEFLFTPPSLSLPLSLFYSQASVSLTLSCRFSSAFVLGLPSHHLPPLFPHIVARFVLQLLYKLLMTAKPNQENEHTQPRETTRENQHSICSILYQPTVLKKTKTFVQSTIMIAILQLLLINLSILREKYRRDNSASKIIVLYVKRLVTIYRISLLFGIHIVSFVKYFLKISI